MGPAMATAIVLAGVSQLLWAPPSPQAPPTRTTAIQGQSSKADAQTVEAGSEEVRPQLLAARVARELAVAQQAATAAAARLDFGESPRVVCGMTILPVDPSTDPRMVKAPPADTRFVIRAIKPPLCVD
jgi:hypothetical protein